LFKIEQRKDRDFNNFKTVSDVINLLKEQFSTRKLHVKYDVDKNEVSINEYNEDKTLMIVTDPNFEPEKSFIIYGLSDKYVEVDLEVVEECGPGYLKCKIKGARRAVEGRSDLRFKINDGAAVATNFRVSKHTIEVSRFNIPTSIKVVLDQFQSANMKFSDKFKVDVLASDTKDAALRAIKSSGKSLFISDLSNTETYKAVNDDFIDVPKVYGHELDQLVKRNAEKGVKSMIIMPIIYMTEDERPVPFAYIQAESKDEKFVMDNVSELKDMSLKLVDRIRDANTLYASVHQQILDVGRGGAKLKITDAELKRYISKSTGFIFDIVFKLQAPITIYGEIRTTSTDSDGNIYLGVNFEGNSSRKDELKRFYDVLKPMEAEYKSNLIKSIKSKL
jgi:hypothetical protein